MTAGSRRSQEGSTDPDAPSSKARLIVGGPPRYGVAANDNPLPFSLKLRRFWVLVSGVLAFGALTAIAFS